LPPEKREGRQFPLIHNFRLKRGKKKGGMVGGGKTFFFCRKKGKGERKKTISPTKRGKLEIIFHEAGRRTHAYRFQKKTLAEWKHTNEVKRKE